VSAQVAGGCAAACGYGDRYRLGHRSVDLDFQDRVQVGLMYSQAMVKPVEAAETGRAMLLVIKGSEK